MPGGDAESDRGDAGVGADDVSKELFGGPLAGGWGGELADFINAFLNAGLQISRVAEPGDEPVPHSIVVAASTTSR